MVRAALISAYGTRLPIQDVHVSIAIEWRDFLAAHGI
jgi:hypothetical protein